MTIELEAIALLLREQLQEELKAVVELHLYQNTQKGKINEVTFQLVIEKCGTRVLRHLYFGLRLDLWDQQEFRRTVSELVKKVIEPDLRRAIRAQQSLKAWSN